VAGDFARREFRAERFGAIAEGYRADLLLLSANPLEDVSRVRVPMGVMVRGRWLSANQ
jgi:imidazolonepropionase-like amidohydrolase